MTQLNFIREGDFMEYYGNQFLVSGVAHVLEIAYTKARDHGPHAGEWQVGVPCHAWYGAKDTLEAAGFEVIGEPR